MIEKRTILKASIISVAIVIALLVIIILLVRTPTYDEVIQLSMARMTGTNEVNITYNVSGGYDESSGTKVFIGTADYAKSTATVTWNYSITDELGTIYDLRPEELLEILSNASYGKYLGSMPTTNGCYRIEAYLYDKTPKPERHIIGGYDIMRITACLDKLNGYPQQYIVSITNTDRVKGGTVIYYTRNLA